MSKMRMLKFKNLSIRARMILCAALPMLVVFVVAYLGLSGLGAVFTGFNDLYRCQDSLRRVLLNGAAPAEASAEAKTLQSFVDSHGSDPKLAVHVKGATQAITKLALLSGRAPAESSASVGEATSSEIQRYSLSESGEARKLRLELRRHMEPLLKATRDHVVSIKEFTDNFVKVAVPLLALITLAAFFLLSGTIRRPFVEAEALIDAVKQGNLAGRLEIDSSNEVGQFAKTLNSMVDELRSQTSQTLEGLRVLTEAASEIASTGAELTRNTSKASSAVTESTATVEQVKHSAQLSAEKAKDVAESSSRTVEIASSGTRAAEDTIDRINLVRNQMDAIADSVVKLSDHTREIDEIIGAVQDLANQSNLLAVNASIQASRAGEQGKGFSVVAHEIKVLADQSKDATQRIRTILDDTRRSVSAVVMTTEQGLKAVDAGVEQSSLAGESIRHLAQSVSASFQAASVIDAQTEQQIAGVAQVSGAMQNIDSAMRQNLAAASQLEGAAGRLQELGSSLKDLILRYQV